MLTDRMQEGARLQQALSALGVCTLSALHKASDGPVKPQVVVCDVALETIESVKTLRAAIDRVAPTPSTPIICMLRDPSHLAVAQARMAGATATLPADTTADQLRAHVHALLEKNGLKVEERNAIRTALPDGIKAVHGLLCDMLKPGAGQPTVTAASLERTSGLLVSAIAQAGLQSWLDIVWTHDDVTYQHCLMVAGLAAAFAQELGLQPKPLNLLSQAALVHDIGKAQIPREILNKAGKLAPAETILMRSHALRGYQMLAGQPGIDPCVRDVVRHHHEFLDGSGYPDQLQGAQISRMVRIVTICDIYAALVERRAYKDPIPPQVALAHMRSLGGRLDEHLLSAFRAVVRDT